MDIEDGKPRCIKEKRELGNKPAQQCYLSEDHKGDCFFGTEAKICVASCI